MLARRLLRWSLFPVGLVACATSPGVATQDASRTATVAPPTAAPPTVAPPTPPPNPPPTVTEPPATASPGPPSTPPATPSPTNDSTPPGPPAAEIFDLGDEKQPRQYDEFLQAALVDVQNWWIETYPALYGEAFEPLGGGIYASYPERSDPIPGCGAAEETTYREVKEFAAFYCTAGDFIVYDDGEEGVVFGLAEEFGPSILGVVLAHEFGHAVQARSGALDTGSPTIVTEQQADCFAGAWSGRAARGEAPSITFSDADVRNGLIAMITVRDPVGIDQFTDGGHGSAFDRVGAFQVGFTQGAQRCAELIDDPLPLVPNEYRSLDDEANQGNLPFGFGEGEIVDLIVTDLNAYWPTTVAVEGGRLDPLTVVPVASADAIVCPDLAGDLATGAALCPATAEVFLDEPLAADLHAEFGDFAVGYMLATAWTEGAQLALASPLTGELRALATDCLVGAWVATIIPDETGQTSGGRDAQVSPGDLDEAIQTALVVGDERASDDVVGSGFEKIASFRDGVLRGLDTCTTLIRE